MSKIWLKSIWSDAGDSPQPRATLSSDMKETAAEPAVIIVPPVTRPMPDAFVSDGLGNTASSFRSGSTKAQRYATGTAVGFVILTSIFFVVSLMTVPKSNFVVSNSRFGHTTSPMSSTLLTAGCSSYWMTSFFRMVQLLRSELNAGSKSTTISWTPFDAMTPSSTSTLKGYWTSTLKRTSRGPMFCKLRTCDSGATGRSLAHKNWKLSFGVDSLNCGATMTARNLGLKTGFATPPPSSGVSLQTMQSSNSPGVGLMASTVNLYDVLGSRIAISGSTRNMGGGGVSSSPRFFFGFLSGTSSFFFLSWPLSRTHEILLEFCPWFLMRMSRASVRVVKMVPKSMKSTSGSHRTGVSMPLPFTPTVKSSPSCTMRFSTSCIVFVSSICNVTASCKVSCGDKWMILGCTLHSDLRSFMNARTEASMQELLVSLTWRVTRSKHLTLPQSNVGGSTCTRGPMEFALRTRGNGTGRP
mmetsp:Transcript_9332/g.26829  ORF Transcript_9332/g.26829 Transcript_9332/m.26829 type:complete len:469 (+) Transcript_9332:2559-3965(+)